jgi:hypothetical protein
MSVKGRKKGSLNYKTQSLIDRANHLGCDPFEVLVLFAKGDWKALGYDSGFYVLEKPDGSTKIGFVITPETRMQAAKEATKYLYSQRKAVEVTGEDGKELGFQIVVKDYISKP